nr:putative alpha/Beta hydrolase [Ipomoea batatas]
MDKKYAVQYCTVETSDGCSLHARIFYSRREEAEVEGERNLVVVLVHPYSILGGCQGLLGGIAGGLAHAGYKAVTFDMRGVGRSTGKPSLTGFKEIRDVVAVCQWVCRNLDTDRILLVGSSAGAPIAGSAVDQVDQIVGYVSIGYPFGFLASVLFGRHHKAVLKSPKPKLFIMGTQDGFTSVKQLKNKLSGAAGRTESHLVEGVGHFELEGPAYDDAMVNLISDFIRSL